MAILIGGDHFYNEQQHLFTDDEMDQRRYRMTANHCLPIGIG